MDKAERIESRKAISETIIAADSRTGRTCFQKREVASDQFPPEFIRQTLLQSFSAQRPLSGLVINKARKITTLADRTVVEYPFLDPANWHPCKTEDFQADPLLCLVEICLAVDYLHLMGVVHLDLKADNILVNRKGGHIRVRLVDLDFLRLVGSNCGGKIWGTGQHIAPEILNNQQVYPETDNYSLGVFFKTLVDDVRVKAGHPLDGSCNGRIDLLVDALLREDRDSRPRFLLATILTLDIINATEYERTARRLLLMLFISKFRDMGRATPDVESFMCFLHENVRVLGIRSEIVSLCAERATSDQRVVIAVFKRLLKESSFTTAGEYWLLKPSDTLLQWAYQLLDPKQEVLSHSVELVGGDCRGDVSVLRQYMQQLKESGRLEQSFLIGKQILESFYRSPNLEYNVQEHHIRRELGSIAYSLNRLAEAHEYFECSTQHDCESSHHKAEVYRKWALANIGLGETNRASNIIRQGLKFAVSINDNHLRLQLSRLVAWQSMSSGHFESAVQSLQEVRNEAIHFGYRDIEALAIYSLGVIDWRQGQYVNARRYLLMAATVCGESNNNETLIPVLSTLSLVLNEMAEFQVATEYAEKASRLCETVGSTAQLPSICLSAVYAHTRLAQHEKGAKWLQRYLACGGHGNSVRYLLAYWQALAFIHLNRGRIEEAVETCKAALRLPSGPSDAKVLGKVYQSLGDACLSSGDIEGCDRYCNLARELFSQCNDATSISEVELILSLRFAVYGASDDCSRTLNTIRDLMKYQSHYCSMAGAYVVFVLGKEPYASNAVKLFMEINDNVSGSEVPLFSVVRHLIELKQPLADDHTTILSALKITYSTLLGSNQLFHAMLTALRVADLYKVSGQLKHQGKYLEQALGVAKSLGNAFFSERIVAQLEETRGSAFEVKNTAGTLIAISKILQQERDFQHAARQLLQFAVDETGAERGVLLLWSGDASRLIAVASLNCDDASILDVTDFSSTVPHSALSNPGPTIVDDALSDERTSSMKSIVIHNVRSIVAAPMVFDSEPLGILYLDHHSIPALFSKKDIEYVSAIANFVAVSLINARNHRDLVLSQNELTQQLSNTGLGGKFITQDSVMLELLDMIPTIAHSDTSVLLVGESGTGKEIISQMIHDHSSRKSRPLVKMNCAAIAGSMIESELFGVARGAATGVVQREGKFAAADGGTLYMDEIGDMPLDVQAKVLRVLEYQEFEKVGSNRLQSVDVRFVYATNKNLAVAVREGKFRNDLLFRINTITIEVPPLRDRSSDVPLLLDHFTRIFTRGKRAIRFTPDAIVSLTAYRWPGNVRELRNLVERFCVLYSGRDISTKMLPSEITLSLDPSDKGFVKPQLQEAELIRSALAGSSWNRSKAAASLGIPLTTLRRKIAKFVIRPPF